MAARLLGPVAEFLFTMACAYTISFPDDAERTPDFLAKTQQAGFGSGLSDITTCLIAIVHHITERFDGLAPAPASAERDRYLSLIAYGDLYCHRQHHPAITAEDGFDGIKAKAREMNDTLFDCLEGHITKSVGVIFAADFYLYMLTRWGKQRPDAPAGRSWPFCDVMRQRDAEAVLAKQPRRKITDKFASDRTWLMMLTCPVYLPTLPLMSMTAPIPGSG